MRWRTIESDDRSHTDLTKPLSGHTATVLGHFILVIGGFVDEGKATARGACPYWLFNTLTDEWKWMDVIDPTDERFAYHTAHLIDDKVYILFGCLTDFEENEEHPLAELRILDPVLGELQRTTLYGLELGRKSRHVAGYFERRREVVVYGGRDHDTWVEQLLVIDVDSKHVRECRAKGEHPSRQPSCPSVVSAGRMFVFAVDSVETTKENVLYIFDYSRKDPVWSKVPGPMSAPGRNASSGGSLNVLGPDLIAFGGRTVRAEHNKLYRYNTRARHWHGGSGNDTDNSGFPVEGKWPKPEVKHRGVVIGERIYFIGGFNKPMSHILVLTNEV